jgi:hypothetical protein
MRIIVEDSTICIYKKSFLGESATTFKGTQ